MTLFHATHSMLERNAVKVLSEVKIQFLCHRMYSTRNHYDVLKLNKNCTTDEVRQSFAKLSKMHHPDTSKTGSAEQNSKKFQEIMEAYRVLSKESSRNTYDLEISSAHYPGPYYATPNRSQRERRFYEGDFASWQQHMHNSNTQNTNGYYRTHGYRDNPYHNPWSPANVLNKKSVYGFLAMFVLFNFFVVYSTYALSRQNRLMAEFDGRNGRMLYRMPRHGMYGINVQEFERNARKDK